MTPKEKKRLQEIEGSIKDTWSDRIYKDIKWLVKLIREKDERITELEKEDKAQTFRVKILKMNVRSLEEREKYARRDWEREREKRKALQSRLDESNKGYRAMHADASGFEARIDAAGELAEYYHSWAGGTEKEPFASIVEALKPTTRKDEPPEEQICGNCADFTMHANHPVSSGQCKKHKFSVGFTYSCEHHKILTGTTGKEVDDGNV